MLAATVPDKFAVLLCEIKQRLSNNAKLFDMFPVVET